MKTLWYSATNPSVKGVETEISLHVVCDCPFLYQLNLEHPEISIQGLRDKKYAIPKPPGSVRMLILGDSVTYGLSVSQHDGFPKQLERIFAGLSNIVEVINAGVSGYTPYNELQYYRENGKTFQADIVIVAFVMNDVVNPRLHWNYTKEAIRNIPIEAIPNLEYDQNHVLPLMREKREKQKFQTAPRWPTHITGEDDIGINVLLDYNSPEWVWLRSIYGKLHTVVTDSGAVFIVMIVSLSYQMDENYPYLPQKLFSRYCIEQSINCLDLLPVFREHRTENLYLGRSAGYDDIWHFTERGHQLAAESLHEYLLKHDLISKN